MSKEVSHARRTAGEAQSTQSLSQTRMDSGDVAVEAFLSGVVF